MSDIDRISSSSQEAARDAQVADQKKTKILEKNATQYGAGQKGVLQDKKLKSSFDDVLKNVSDQGAQVFAPDAKFDSRLKEVQKDKDHSSSERDTEDDRKEPKKSEGTKENKETSQSVKERVVAKHGSGEQKQDSGSGSGEQREGRSGQGFSQKGESARMFAAEQKKAQTGPAPTPEMAGLNFQTVTPPEATEVPRELPKAVLDQIIQYVRIGLNKELNKEIQVDFHDQVFNGLRLKVTAHGKEVSVEFIVPNRAVQDCFKQEREKIALALGEKGVDVRSITVTLL